MVDAFSGLQKQTIESLEMLKKRKVPFVVAMNKIDRINQWVPAPNAAIQNSLKKQSQTALNHFETQLKFVKLSLCTPTPFYIAFKTLYYFVI